MRIPWERVRVRAYPSPLSLWKRVRVRAGLPLLVVPLALSACNPGAYPLDYFREMHYQQSQRLLEPDRLAPPAGSVPRTGSKVAISFADASRLQNPVRRTPEAMRAAAETFRVNCGACHGQDGRGDSFVGQRFAAAGFVPPADLTSARVRNRVDGELYWIVNYGLGNMPPFQDLLTDEQIWGLVLLLREVQGPP